METSTNNFNSNDQMMVISEEIRGHLLVLAKWATFLAVLGFIGLGIMVILALFTLLLGSTFANFTTLKGGTVIYAAIFIILAVLYYFPLSYLYRAAKELKASVYSVSQDLLTSGFKNLKLHFRFIGILAIVMLSIYALIFIAGMIGMSVLAG